MNETEIARIAAAMNALRPDWPLASLRTLLAEKLAARPRRDVAVALAWVACESDTQTPARVLEQGPWWKAAAVEDGATASNPTARTVGNRHADPREVCGICAMYRHECEQRAHVSGHAFLARADMDTRRAESEDPDA